ncbi:hypothetical protein [Microbispora sp. H10885]|uniref:DUF4760 domain-containing protein n=1 Tax=Microbispora sp. H10885 TaxID=2729110 RepID=UPI00160141D3|nr:hypothetical protein [Microbispora sp. H10885]
METVATVAAAVSSIAAVAALGLVLLQLRNQGRQLKQMALTTLHEELLKPEMQKAIRSIYAATPQELAVPKNDEELERIESVLNQYDLIGSRTQCGVIPKDQTLATEWSIVLRLWHQLSLFIERETHLRGGGPYKSGFKWLVEMSEQYRLEHYPNSRTIPFARVYPGRDSRELLGE